MISSVLTYDACAPHLTWTEAVEALRQGHMLPHPQHQDIMLGTINGGLLTRVASVSGLGFAVKSESIFPENLKRGRASIQGFVLLFGAETGEPRAIIESRLITQIKTAADSLLGASYLARADSRHLVIVGAGAVAETLARGYDNMFSNLERISIWSRRPEQAQSLAKTLHHLRSDVVPVEDLPATVGAADIVATATWATSPILCGAWVKPGTHVDLIGAYTPEMREADDALIAAGLIYVDFSQTVVRRIGELMQPIQNGIIGIEDVRGDLYDLARLPGYARQSADQITIFKNGGGAHLDLMIADYVVRTMNKVSQSECSAKQ